LWLFFINFLFILQKTFFYHNIKHIISGKVQLNMCEI
jgi:hypothetical protein